MGQQWRAPPKNRHSECLGVGSGWERRRWLSAARCDGIACSRPGARTPNGTYAAVQICDLSCAATDVATLGAVAVGGHARQYARMQLVAGVLWFGFLALGAATIGSALSRPGSRRFGQQRHDEIVTYNPPAAFFVAWGRLFPILAKATLVAGLAAIVAVVLAQ